MVSIILISLLQLTSGLLDRDVHLPWQLNIDPQRAEALTNEDVLIIKGINPNQKSELLVIRFDDRLSHDYYSRANLERYVRPGSFELRIPFVGLKKENKEVLKTQQLRKLYVFSGKRYKINKSEKQYNQERIKKVVIKSISIEQDKPFPQHIQVYDFGARQSELLEGSQRVNIAVNNKSFSAVSLFGNMKAIERPGPEPWARDGIAGIEELRIPLEKGLWRVVLFREDLGEWENLPRQLNLKLAINDIEQKESHFDHSEFDSSAQDLASQWFHREYLKFYHQPALSDPWDDIVQHRGLVQSYDFEQETGELSIKLLGETPQQRFISGMILQRLDEKLHQPKNNGLALVNQRRKAYFKQHWMVENTLLETTANSKDIQLKKLRLAQGEGRLVEFDVEFEKDVVPQWESSFIAHGGYLEVRQSIPRWHRSGSEQYIKKSYRQLSELTQKTLKKGAYKISLWLKSNEHQSGLHDFNLAFVDNNKTPLLKVQLDIEVVDQRLPLNEQKVGIYLDYSPHLQFFKEWQPLQLAQTYCDLNYLDRLNLRALSPPMALPTEDSIKLWLNELALYKEFYGEADLLAYTPYKRLKEVLNEQALNRKVGKLSKLSYGDINVYWSIADEAQKDTLPRIKQDAQGLHSANQFAKTAGHLNNPAQKSLIKQLDLVLINHGFGVDKGEIERIQKSSTRTLGSKKERNKRVWLYNMPDFRLAAGAFLWHSKADAYVQWHGRMPTANPYDPTDGREADNQFFYPQPIACAALPDIDKGLFELAMGQYDLRWYLWLEQQSEGESGIEAQRLLHFIQNKLGENWQHAQSIDHSQLDSWREQIITLAQSLKQPDKDSDAKLSGVQNDYQLYTQRIYQ